MPVILRNNATSIEVDFNANLKYTINKGDFDVGLTDTGQGDVAMVTIVLSRSAIIKNYIELDWRDVSPPPVVGSAIELRDLLLSWNMQAVIVSVAALPDGAATEDNQTNGSQKAQAQGKSFADFVPNNSVQFALNEIHTLLTDIKGALVVRGQVLTDEGSVYDPFAGSALSADWTKSEGTGTSVAVANSVCILTAGTTAGSKVSIDREFDFPPITLDVFATISQRIANQDIYIGTGDNSAPEGSDTMFARFHFYGTDNTLVSCETQSSTDTGGNEGKNTQKILPLRLTTAQQLHYKIISNAKTVRFYVGLTGDELVLIDQHSIEIPDPYTIMYGGARIHNGITPATSTTVTIDTVVVSNNNIVDITGEITGDVSIDQDIKASVVNSSSTNLDAGNGYTFTGKAESSLNVAGLQVSLFANQGCIIKIQQSPDGTNWDMSDQYSYVASGNFGVTVQAISSYFRVIVNTLANATTTIFRLQSVLCPMVESLPRSLDQNQNLKIANPKDEYNFSVENTPVGEMRVVNPTRLVGANFEGSAIDTQFWVSGVANSGDVSQLNSDVTLSTKTVAPNGMARFYSYRRARYVSGNSMCYRSVVQLSAAVANNKRRWGIAYASTMPTTGTTDLITDGAWFQFDGLTFSVATRRAGTANETKIDSGAFNGTLGATYAPGTTVKTYEIYWTSSKVYFVIGGQILHTFSADTQTWSSTMNLYIYFDNVNSGNIQTDHTLNIRVASIRRLGSLLTQPTSYYFATGQTAGVNLKLSAGSLHSIILSNVVGGAVITLSDSISAATPVIWTLTAAAQENSVSLDFKGIPFFFGLRLTVSTKNASIVVIYE